MLGSKGREGLQGIFERAHALADTPHADVHIVELLSVYLKFEPQRGVAWFYFGDALRNLGRLQESEEALLEAADLAPKDSRFAVYARIGMLITQRGSPADAERWFRVATSELGCPGWIWLLRGANLLHSEAYRLAKSCLETALTSEDVEKEEALLNLALLERAQRRYQEARKYLNDALAIEPNYDEAKKVLRSLVGIEETIELAARVAEEVTGIRKVVTDP